MGPAPRFPAKSSLGRGSRQRGKKGKKKKNRNPNKAAPAEEAPGKVPRSMVFARGSVGKTLRRLEDDMRRVMSPHTASKLKESKRNTLKDFLQVAGPLGVTHFLVFSASPSAPYLRMARAPRGPTLTFKIHQYSLAADVANSQAKPRVPPKAFHAPPLVVMHGFGPSGQLTSTGGQHLKLVSIMAQNMFPSIDVSAVKLSGCRRVLLLSHDAATGLIELRHYTIRAKPLGVSRSLRKLVETHAVPDLSAFADVSEFVLKAGYGSESEGEDEASHVQLPQDMGRGTRATQQSAVQLHELGPRLTLELIKVEQGLLGGEVMFHRYIKKSPEQAAQVRRQRKEREELKQKRRREQEENVERKVRAKQFKPRETMSSLNEDNLHDETE